MKQELPREVLEAFINDEPADPMHVPGETVIEIVGGGLINQTYKVQSKQQPAFILQQINKNVFAHPEEVQENYTRIWEYVELKDTGLRLPAPLSCGEKATLFVDKQEQYWRAFEFIDETRMFHIAETPEQAKATAIAFAKFTTALAGFNVGLLNNTITGFHDVSLRFRQFEEAVDGVSASERLLKSLPIIEELNKRQEYQQFYEGLKGSAEYPQRVMHHDAKIANVLFSNKNGAVICLVDFDTVMPGYYFSDLGDMIRSMASGENENSTDFDKICIRKEFYEAILTGYKEIMGEQLTPSEKKYIHYAGLLMIYMQALRFLTDYLDNDRYYHITYLEQNIDRAKNQLILLQKLEEFLLKNYQFKV